MRNCRLFPTLAVQSIRNNWKFYFPYILALLGDVAAIYIMSALVRDPGVKDMTPGRPNAYMYVELLMSLGMVIAYLFSAVFVLYINGFLMKQRKKELGLYNILGMGKGHIALVLVVETLIIGAMGIGGGIAVGLILHKLVSLFLHRMIGMPVPLDFYISWDGMALTAALFAALLGTALLVNLNKVRVSKPIELLHGGNVGEREPKTRWLLTVLGVLTLGAGYYIAVTTRTGVDAVVLYFVAVFLVIVGTYCLFTAVSIAVLKALRSNKKFYYKTSRFIGVSGMLHRMKQNAVGLANICILCTMVMVMLSGTLSLYLGTERAVDEQYPGDINVKVVYYPDNRNAAEDGSGKDPFSPEAMLAVQTGFVEGQGYKVLDARTCLELDFGAGLLDDGTYTTDRSSGTSTYVYIAAITEADYTAATGEVLDLGPGEIAAYGARGDELTIRWRAQGKGTELGESTYRIVRRLRDNPRYSPMIMGMVTLVLPDTTSLHELWARQAEAYGNNLSPVQWFAYLNLESAGRAELEELEETYVDYASYPEEFYVGTGSWISSRGELRSEGEE
ncbi:MAG: FtsX-like permease family protein, partial [Oscillospiraceae bacterium]|nr:FtsX-like permease family protein [Oscillospiraceae bacterium]